MSNQRVIATLRHWNGPVFPACIPVLQSAFSNWAPYDLELDGRTLIAAAERVAGYRNPGTERTDDGYFWARTLTFKVVRHSLFAGQVVIAFPYCTDEENIDGTHTDRSIAIYYSGAVTEEEAAHAAQEFTNSFCQLASPRAAA